MIYEFAATQDFNGWGKPWGPGGNENMINPPIDRTVTEGSEKCEHKNGVFHFTLSGASGAFDENFALQSNYEITENDVCYFFNSAASSSAVFYLLFTDNTASSSIYLTSVNRSVSLASYAGKTVKGLRFYIGAQYEATVKPLIGVSGITEWTPYSNVCMPEGFNIWDPTTAEYVQVYAGYVNSNTRELYLRPVYQEYAGEELVGPWMSSMDEYSEDATPTEGAFVIDFGGELESFEITPFMLQTLLDSLGIRQHFTDGAGLLNKLMDQAQGRVRSEDELLHLSRPLNVIAIGDQLPAGITFKPISKDVLPGLPGKFIR